MLVYLKLLFQNENIVVYEYGLTEEKMIGKVIVSLHNKNFSLILKITNHSMFILVV